MSEFINSKYVEAVVILNFRLAGKKLIESAFLCVGENESIDFSFGTKKMRAHLSATTQE